MEVNESITSEETPNLQTPEETPISQMSKEEETLIQFSVETPADEQQQSSEEVTASLVTTTIDLSGISPEGAQVQENENPHQPNTSQSDEIEIAVAMVHDGEATEPGDVTLQENVVNNTATPAEDVFDDTDCTYFVARTHSELREIIRVHAEATGAQFCMSKRAKYFGNESKCLSKLYYFVFLTRDDLKHLYH